MTRLESALVLILLNDDMNGCRAWLPKTNSRVEFVVCVFCIFCHRPWSVTVLEGKTTQWKATPLLCCTIGKIDETPYKICIASIGRAEEESVLWARSCSTSICWGAAIVRPTPQSTFSTSQSFVRHSLSYNALVRKHVRKKRQRISATISSSSLFCHPSGANGSSWCSCVESWNWISIGGRQWQARDCRDLFGQRASSKRPGNAPRTRQYKADVHERQSSGENLEWSLRTRWMVAFSH